MRGKLSKGDDNLKRTPEERLSLTMAHLRIKALLSEERERIYTPVQDKGKYKKLCRAICNCWEVAKEFNANFDATDPDFPCACHIITLEFPAEDEIVLRETKSKLVKSLTDATEVNIDTNAHGNIRMCIGFEDVYTKGN